MANHPRADSKANNPLPLDQVPVTNPHDLSAVYANHFGVSATMTDFTLYFLELGQIPALKGTVQKQEIKAIVTLPLAAGIGMVQVLQQLLKQHSEQVAQITKATAAQR